MNRYHLVHVTEFRYDGPVSESYNEVRLRPIDDDRQSCLSFRLSSSPATRNTSYRDFFGNTVHTFNLLSEHRQLKVEAESTVLVHDVPPSQPDETTLAELDSRSEEFREDFFDFLAATDYVPRLPALADLSAEAERAGAATVEGFAQAASGLIHARFHYQKGATSAYSSIKDSLARGAGVCQDFAHLLLGVLRSRGVPGRYVSGYIIPQSVADDPANVEHVIGGQASHAWVEAWLPVAGWTAFDPTLGAPVGSRHVRIAYGRDYSDVAPVRGVYKGHAGQRLYVDVAVRPTLDSEGHEQLIETSARPVEPVVLERAQQPAQQ